MHPTGFEIFAWAAAFLANVALATILWVRGRAQSFPFFTLFILKQIVDAAVTYFVISRVSYLAYQNYYFTMGALEEVLQLLVFYEIAVHVFRPTGVWARDIRNTLVGLVGLSVVIAFLLALLAEPVAPRFVQTVVLRGNFFAAVLLSELCVGMAVLSGTVGLPWKTHVARIAQGLGTYSLVRVGFGIIENVVGIRRGGHAVMTLRNATSATYIGCAVYWIVTLWAEAPVPRELPEAMRIQIFTLQRQVENDLRRIRAWRQS